MVGAARREYRLSPNADTALGVQILQRKLNAAAKENRRHLRLAYSK